MNENPVIVTHVITDVGMGGAEMMLYELLKNIQNKRIKFYVVSLSGTDIIGEKIKDLGIDLTVLNINPKLPNPIKIFKLLKTLNKQRPDVVHTWMYHADFLGGIAAWLLKTKHIIWHIHNSTLSDSSKISATRIIQKLNSYLSHYIPTKIISCSLKAKEIHVNIGYDQKKFEFIPNGFDTDKFKKEIETKNKIRKEINIPSSSKVIGMVGRYNPQKDLGNFIAAANMLIKQGNEVFFVLCGKGLTSDNHKLKNLIDEEALKYFRLLGLRTNIPNLLNSFDLFSLSSAYGEAFPLVVGEAMSTELPCVVTNVGDSALLVEETGIVVPPESPELLAKAWLKILNLPTEKRNKLGEEARNRIKINFSIEKISAQFEREYLLVKERYSNGLSTKN